MMLLVAVGCGEAPVAEKHTNDVVTTLRRIVSFFPPEEHQQVRERLAENLEAVVSLRLLPNKKGTSRVPAVEIMRSTRSIRECIKDPTKTPDNDRVVTFSVTTHGNPDFARSSREFDIVRQYDIRGSVHDVDAWVVRERQR